MDLQELLRAINTVAQTGAPPVRCEQLAREVYRFADMVGWSIGTIDASGRLLDRLASLQADLDLRYAQTRDVSIAALHDALTDLGRAIASHDDDIESGGYCDDENDNK